jgi:hypothetical protein
VKMLKKTLWISAVTALWIHAAGAQLATTANPVGAVDNIPPAPVTNLQALVASGADARSVALTWTLSIDDARSFTSVGGVIVPTGDVRGYRVYRQGNDGVDLLLATLSPGVREYIDNTVVDGLSYIYSVRPFDLDNESDIDAVAGSNADLARIVLVGGASQVVVETTIKGKMTINSSLNLADTGAVDLFSSQFIQDLAALLGISSSRIKITGLASGSIIVSFEIAEPATGTQEISATASLEKLKTEVTGGTNAFDSLGGVLALNDESTSVLVPVSSPLDSAGNVILGWFTRQGNTVGFDDFFLFADHFGTSQGDAGYDALFDIVPNGSIDFEDFFRFADDFGKVIANASVITGG